MTSILALSVTGKIEQYGAYAGFAAVLGLAVLSLLYFAQAREVKRLREWAGRAPERAADLQDRVQSAAQQRVVAQPVAPRPAGPVPAAVPGAAARPAAATPAGQAQGVGAPAAAAAAATAAGAATAAPAVPGAPPAPGAGQPTTVQPAANGASAAPQPKPGQPLRVPPSAATPPPPRAGSGATPEPEEHGRSIWAILGAAAALVVVGLVLVFVVFGVGGGSSDQQAGNTIADSGAATTTTPGAGAKTTTNGAPAPEPGSYTVAVLNGTAVPGLARGVANRLQNTKFKIGNVTNAADQTRSATLVEYAPGHLAEAQAVAKAIDVGKDAIQRVDSGSRAIAGEQASVVVIVGSDQNTSPQTTP
jgi:hypothetical protein